MHGIDVLLNGVWGDQLFRPLHHRFRQWRRRLRLGWNHFLQKRWLRKQIENELMTSRLTGFPYIERHKKSLLGPRACQSDSWEHLFFSRPDFQVVSPYRDVELISRVLSAKAEPDYLAPSKPHLRALAACRLPSCVSHKQRRTSLEPLFVEMFLANRHAMKSQMGYFKCHLEPWIRPRILDQWINSGPDSRHYVPFWMAHTYSTWQGQFD